VIGSTYFVLNERNGSGIISRENIGSVLDSMINSTWEVVPIDLSASQ